MAFEERLPEGTAIKTKHGGQSAYLVIIHHELKQWPSLGPQFQGKKYGYNTDLVCFSVAVINSIANNKCGDKGVNFRLHLLFRGESGRELKAGAMGGGEGCLLVCSLEFV